MLVSAHLPAESPGTPAAGSAVVVVGAAVVSVVGSVVSVVGSVVVDWITTVVLTTTVSSVLPSPPRRKMSGNATASAITTMPTQASTIQMVFEDPPPDGRGAMLCGG
jgi:hypothetical protein